MRPVKLTMSAFGPYSGKTEIGFDKLGKNGIYLITGDTGAGKTTIFDAITFALFGRASGSNREANMLRSQYAAAGTPTEVALEFEYAGKTYFVKRNPDYKRPKERGEGFTEEKANAELLYPDGRVVTKRREVDAAIVEILGVDREQFSQIAMIAQGDFLKLLLATTEDRKKIFQKLFCTKNYSTLQDDLRNESGKLAGEYEDISRSIRQYMSGIACEEGDALFAEAERVKNGESTAEDAAALLAKLIERDEAKREQTRREIEKTESGMDEIQKRVIHAKAQEDARASREAARKKLAEALPRLEALTEEQRQAREKEPEIGKLAARIAALNAELPDYQALDAKRKRLRAMEAEIAKNQNAADGERKSLESMQAEIDALKAEAQALKDAGMEKMMLERQQAALTQTLDAIADIEKKLRELSGAEEKLSRRQAEYKALSEDAKTKKDAYEAKNQAYLDEQAGILAERLREGAPCPVCGSREHPQPAVKSAAAPTKEELEQAKRAAEAAGERAAQASREANGLLTAVGEKRSVILDSAKQWTAADRIENIPPVLGQKKEAYTRQREELQKQLDEAVKRAARKQKVENLLPQKEKERDEKGKAAAELEKTLTALETEQKSAAQQIGELREKLSFASEQDACGEIGALAAQKKSFEDAITQADSNRKDCEDQITKLHAQMEQADILLKDRVDCDIPREEENLQKLKTQKAALSQSEQAVSTRLTINGANLAKIQEKAGALSRVEKRWTWVKALSDTANGDITGKEKIKLETYIQMTYFDRIIARANTRLMVMTGGQYELKRRLVSADNRSQSGLELDVTDHYNGSERSAKSLSGGESFKAALSLALGLSDEIQSAAGGIRLDTMFVDEGFGSLDEESIEQAMRALAGLTEGNKLVGVISHVAALKEKIDRQIVVKKEKSGGSTVKIVT